MTRPRSRGWRRPAVWAAALAVAAAAGGTALAESSGPGARGYRTVSATIGSVDGLLRLPATLQPTTRVTATFGVAGTVATVAVHVGQPVTAGEVLATLETTTLQQKVNEAQANLTAAQAALAADEAGQVATDPPAGGGAGDPGPAGQHPGGPAGAPTTVTAAQQAVTSAQQTADADQQTATTDVATAASTCGGTGAAPTTASTGGKGGTVATPAACKAALSSALSAEQALSGAEDAVASAEQSLAQLLGGSTPGSGTTSPTPPTSTAPTGRTAHAQAQQVATDQATVDTDRATLIDAQQSLTEADLTSPVAGTVAAVGVAAGETVSPGTSTQAITVLSQASFEAVATLVVSQVPEVAVGDPVTVDVDGRTGAVRGKVARIGPVDTAAGDSYPLVVPLPAGTKGLFAGSLAQLAVVVRTAHHALVVPTSAVHTGGGGPYVMCLRHGRLQRVPVVVGVVGGVHTQVRSGLRRGETVVLAVLTRPLPSPSGSVTGRRGGVPLPVFFGPGGPGGFVGHPFFGPGFR